MHKRPCRLVLLLLATSLGLTGCGAPPTKEMNQAQGAIDAARAAGAAQYAADEFAAAEGALSRSHQAVTDRDYRLALAHALDARERAQTSAAQAAEERARLRTEADRALRGAEAGVEVTRRRLQAAVDAKLPAADLTAAHGQLAAADETLDSARTLFDKDEYRKTLDALTGLQARLDDTTSQIDAAIEARQIRRPARRIR